MGLRRIGGGAVILAAAAGAVLADSAVPIQDAVALYAQLAGGAGPSCPAPTEVRFAVEPDPQSPLEAEYDANSGRLRLRYRMAFNQITEGWNWHPEALAESADYYRYKFLPLGSVAESRPAYHAEDKLGEVQTMRVEWRYDYFFAFDNLYDFYPRTVDDDAGFDVELAVDAVSGRRLAAGAVRMVLTGRLDARCLSESTTFWKAIHARPVDFTLKKRYLIGHLDAVAFYDRDSGRLLARAERRAGR